MTNTQNISTQQDLLNIKRHLPIGIYELIEKVRKIGRELAREWKNTDFGNTIQAIDSILETEPVDFVNGEVPNTSGENLWSLKVLAFGKMMWFHTQEVLSMFWEYYREVIDNPDGNSHQNIRALQKTGIECVDISENPFSLTYSYDNIYELTPKEIEVANLFAQWYSNQQAAKKLDISIRTIEVHRFNLRKKMWADKLQDVVKKLRKMPLVKWPQNIKTIIKKKGHKKFQLTDRECQILELLAAWDINKQIAHKLNVSVRTIETHRANIRKKTDNPSSTSDFKSILEKIQA